VPAIIESPINREYYHKDSTIHILEPMVKVRELALYQSSTVAQDRGSA
jgi:hypothetical protein